MEGIYLYITLAGNRDRLQISKGNTCSRATVSLEKKKNYCYYFRHISNGVNVKDNGLSLLRGQWL